MKLYILKEDYIKFLANFDVNVKANKSEKRPYIGIVFEEGFFKYFSPLASPKEKHKVMNEKIDFIKIKNGELGAINLNNSVPILGDVVQLVDIKLLQTSNNENERKYGELCADQIIWCNNNAELIKKKFRKLYTLYCNNILSEKMKERCCNFKLLEEKAIEHKK